MRYDPARWTVIFVLLVPVLAARADELITGAPGEGVVIGNPPGDWHSPASARYELDRFVGGLDADEAGDRFGYRLFGGSRFERDDNELILPIAVEGNTIDLMVATLAAGEEAKPLDVTLNGRAVGQVPLGGRNNDPVTAAVRFKCDAGYALLRLVVSEPGRPVFIDAVRMIGARLTGSERTFETGAMRWTLPRSASDDDTFRLWTFGRYLKGCTERRSHDYEIFRVKRKRINRGGYRQVDAAHDTWHNLFQIKRDADGRQVENWAEMGRRWYIGSADTSASDQTRGFQIAFDSPVAGTGRLVLHATPDAPPTSLVMVVNGDRQHARIGIGQPGVAGPSSWEVDPHADVEGKMDLQPGRATVYEHIAVRAGHNTIDLDYAGFSFLWPDTTCGWRWTRLSHHSGSPAWRSRSATRSWSS